METLFLSQQKLMIFGGQPSPLFASRASFQRTFLNSYRHLSLKRRRMQFCWMILKCVALGCYCVKLQRYSVIPNLLLAMILPLLYHSHSVWRLFYVSQSAIFEDGNILLLYLYWYSIQFRMDFVDLWLNLITPFLLDIYLFLAIWFPAFTSYFWNRL